MLTMNYLAELKEIQAMCKNELEGVRKHEKMCRKRRSGKPCIGCKEIEKSKKYYEDSFRPFNN